jgi:hypothetical protein
MKLIKQALYLSTALAMAGCSTSQPVSVGGVDRVIGNALPGAQGQTINDQDRIDDTVARACAAGLYSTDLCDRHTVASAERRAELAKISGAGV